MHFVDPEACAEEIVRRVGQRIVLGLPLGLGKPNHVVNALYRLAEQDRTVQLEIMTALTLARPRWSNDLERRLVEPLVERIFGNYPELAYTAPRADGALPSNVTVSEFYLSPGPLTRSANAQQDYASVNYTEAVERGLAAGVNVFGQLVSPGTEAWSLSGNTDITLDLLRETKRLGHEVLWVGQAHPRLPYMFGEAEVPTDTFDLVLEPPDADFTLFGPPNQPVSVRDYHLGLHASALVRDGGTLQLGIGALGDAVTQSLIVRHEQPRLYQSLVGSSPHRPTMESIGGLSPFDTGLYASTEMFVEGYLHLYRAGILRRKVDGALLHAGFFLGPSSMYAALRDMPPEERKQFQMTPISFVNQLEEGFEKKVAQRVHARFLNAGMIATLMGAVASDGLEDGLVISGVGGQHDFVLMGHRLPGARSVLMVRATHEDSSGNLESSIRFSYGHTTIPRHLRDLLVTEYGVADLRGKTDREVVEAMIAVSDSRFQRELIQRAKRAKKLPQSYRLPDFAKRNVPDELERSFGSAEARQAFTPLPFGSDVTEVEVELTRALRALPKKPRVELRALRGALGAKDRARAHLKRMQLFDVDTPRELALQRAVLYGLAKTGALE